LSRSRSFPCTDHYFAIACYYWGPIFGDRALYAAYEPFNKPMAWESFGIFHSYRIPVSEGINMLTNKKSFKHEFWKEKSVFTITEIEVWGVTFLE
jgi:hypothetical protein